jgi:hypothetical protein
VKLRDYIFWTVLTLAALVLEHAVVKVIFAPQPPAVRTASVWERVQRWWVRRSDSDDLFRETLPDDVVNAAPERTVGPDGEPLLAHGKGW